MRNWEDVLQVHSETEPCLHLLLSFSSRCRWLSPSIFRIWHNCSTAVQVALVFTSTVISISTIIINLKWESSLLRYFAGLYFSWFMIWSANILFNSKSSDCKHIQQHSPLVGSRDLDNYFWQPLPDAFTWVRAFWTLDLVTNFRETGWNHAHQRWMLITNDGICLGKEGCRYRHSASLKTTR